MDGKPDEDRQRVRKQRIKGSLPTTDGRHLVMPRYTQPEPDQAILLHKLKLSLPPQPAPRIKAEAAAFSKDLFKM